MIHFLLHKELHTQFEAPKFFASKASDAQQFGKPYKPQSEQKLTPPSCFHDMGSWPLRVQLSYYLCLPQVSNLFNFT